MIITNESPFIANYVDQLNKILAVDNKQLTALQSCWLKFILLGILITNSVCWKKIERFSIAGYSFKAISWMFRRSKIYWYGLLTASTSYLIKLYKISNCILVVDDTDIQRSKNATKIGKLHKIKDKKTNGYFMGQNIIKLLLIANGITLLVGFKLYEPDSKLRQIKLERKRLKAKGVTKQHLPKLSARNPLCPTKTELAIELLTEFVEKHNIKIMAVVADALYGCKQFVTQAKLITKSQIVTEVKSDQHIVVNNKSISISKFFSQYYGKKQQIQLRYKNRLIQYVYGKFVLKSHKQKYLIIALKFDNEEKYRYLIASDMSWQPLDIIKAFSQRWLVEVFIQDWKSYEGWNSMAKQTGVDGSVRGIILSLLCDHALLTHPKQIALFKKWEPACTVGSLIETVKIESLLEFIESIIKSDNPQEMFNKHHASICKFFELRPSKKHVRNNSMPSKMLEDSLFNKDLQAA
jgi:hypothetical protein